MKKHTHFFLVVFLMSIISQMPALADWTDIPADDFEMAPPPQKGSANYTKDFETLLKYQESNREEACELSKSQLRGTYQEFFSTTSLLTSDEFERAENLVARAMKYTMNISGVFKNEYTRLRPYDADSRIKPCAKKPGGTKSYPSSHAAAGVVGGCSLAAIFPGKATALKAYGKYLGDIRFMVGVHHPSDVVAGQKLGQDICKALLKNAEFIKEIESIK